jgi:hypothetical protein
VAGWIFSVKAAGRQIAAHIQSNKAVIWWAMHRSTSSMPVTNHSSHRLWYVSTGAKGLVLSKKKSLLLTDSYVELIKVCWGGEVVNAIQLTRSSDCPQEGQ